MANNLQKGSGGPMRLFVGSLHFNITEDMLRGIFEPFGKVSRKWGKPLNGFGKVGRVSVPLHSVWAWLTHCMQSNGRMGPCWES